MEAAESNRVQARIKLDKLVRPSKKLRCDPISVIKFCVCYNLTFDACFWKQMCLDTAFSKNLAKIKEKPNCLTCCLLSAAPCTVVPALSGERKSHGVVIYCMKLKNRYWRVARGSFKSVHQKYYEKITFGPIAGGSAYREGQYGQFNFPSRGGHVGHYTIVCREN